MRKMFALFALLTLIAGLITYIFFVPAAPV
jgi:hypothetical protein